MGDHLGTKVFSFISVLIISMFAICESWSDTCQPPILPYGRVRLRDGGSVAKFNCRQGFMLWGSKYITCIQGMWNAEPPICVRPGCRPLLPLYKGKIMVTFQGAIATLICEPGYFIKANGKANPPKAHASIYCDGRKWNVTSYYCLALPTSPAPITSTSLSSSAITDATEVTTTPAVETTTPTTSPPQSSPNEGGNQSPNVTVKPSQPSLFPSIPPPPTPPPPPPPPPPSLPPTRTTISPPSTPSPTRSPTQPALNTSTASPSTTSTTKTLVANVTTAAAIITEPSSAPNKSPAAPTWCDFDGNVLLGTAYVFSSRTFSWRRNPNGRLVKMDYSGPTCGWTVTPLSDDSWLLKSGVSKQSNVTAVGDVRTTKPLGNYMYVHSSRNLPFVLQSPTYNSSLSGSKTSPACIIFWYTLQNGDLNVTQQTAARIVNLRSFHSNPATPTKASTWVRASVPLRLENNTFSISLIANSFGGSDVEIAVDNLWVTSGEACTDSSAGSSEWRTSVTTVSYQTLSTASTTTRVSTLPTSASSAPPPPRKTPVARATTTLPSSTPRVPTKRPTPTTSPPRTKPTRTVTKAPIRTTVSSTTVRNLVPKTPMGRTTRVIFPSKPTKSTFTKPPVPATTKTVTIVTLHTQTRSSTESDIVTLPGWHKETSTRADDGVDLNSTAVPHSSTSASVIWIPSVTAVVILLAGIGIYMFGIRNRRLRRLREGGDGDSEVRYLTSDEEQLDFTLQKVVGEGM